MIKICGLSTLETLETAVTAGADMVGFVFFPKSPRHLSVEIGAQLAATIRGRSELVALTVDADDNLLQSLVDAWKPAVIQCHGVETTARLRDIRTRFNIPIMKALGISEQDDLKQIEYYAPHCDMLLVDAKPPKNAILPGGNGETFNWDLMNGVTCSVPLFLSGGLSPENVSEAITRTHVQGVDVSSGVERTLGIKDLDKIKLFIENAKRAFSEKAHLHESFATRDNSR